MKNSLGKLMLVLLLVQLAEPLWAAEQVRIGVLAFRSKEQTLRQWQPLAEKLQQKIPGSYFVIEPLNGDEIDFAVSSRNVDFVLTNPSQYARLAQENSLSSPLATLITRDRGLALSAFGGVIFSLKERSDINTLEDLRGKRVAVVDASSFGAYQIQAYELVRKGIELPRDAHLLTTGMPHDQIIEKVLNGEADIGFVRTGVLEAMSQEGKLDLARLKILNAQDLPGWPLLISTRLYPEWPFAAMPHIDPNLASDVAAVLYQLHDDTVRTQRMGIVGFTVPADYKVVTEMLKTLRLPPFDVEPEFTLLDVWSKYRWWIVVSLLAGGMILILLVSVWRSKQRLAREREVVLQQQHQLEESERRYRFLFNNNPMSMFIFSEDELRFLEVNEQTVKHYGYTREEFMKMTIRDIRPPQELSQLDRVLQGTPAGIVSTEATHRKKDGTPINVIVSTMPMLYAGVKSRIVLVNDITDRKRAEQELLHYKDHLEEEVQQRTAELRENSARLADTQFAMDKVGIGIHWIDPDTGRFLYVNDFAAQMLGYSREEMMKMGIPDIDPNYLTGDFRERTRPLLEAGSATIETTERHRDGHLIPLEVTFYYQPAQEGRESRIISFVSDISMRKQAEELLVNAKNAAESANRAKSVFLANMSHELRTPLNAILGFSNILGKDEHLTESQRKSLRIINRSGQHLLKLINDVLEMAKIDAGRIKLEEAPFDLGNMVRDIADMMSIRASEKGLQLLIDQSSNAPRYIIGDEARLRQILINLIGNAIKYTEQGGVTLRLETRHNAIDHLRLEVEDSGPGIAPQDQQRIFEPFVQLGEHAIGKGTGLGLTITREFVRLMGGVITLHSTPGQGSIFCVELPLREAAQTDIAEPQVPEHGDVIGLAPNQPEYRILIVEDQEANQLLLARLMENIGLSFKVAANGKQGVEIFQSWQPHFIWMDRRMPVMDGMEATREIRQLPGGRDVKIVAVTASAFMEQRKEMLEVGMDDFVRKPYRQEEIYSCLSKQLGLQYLYAGVETLLEVPDKLTAEQLVTLPAPLRDELRAALESLERSRIARVLEQVAEIDAGLHKTLAGLVDQFDYPSILGALANNK